MSNRTKKGSFSLLSSPTQRLLIQQLPTRKQKTSFPPLSLHCSLLTEKKAGGSDYCFLLSYQSLHILPYYMCLSSSFSPVHFTIHRTYLLVVFFFSFLMLIWELPHLAANLESDGKIAWLIRTWLYNPSHTTTPPPPQHNSVRVWPCYLFCGNSFHTSYERYFLTSKIDTIL